MVPGLHARPNVVGVDALIDPGRCGHLPLQADDISIVLNTIPSTQNILFIGNGAILHKEIIKEKFQNKAYFSKNNEQTSISTGKCAYHKFLNNQIDTANSLTPLYLRKSQAERMQDLGKSNN